MSKPKKPARKNFIQKVDAYIRTYNYLGLVFAVVFFCLSIFPSLLPRSWFFQGLISGAALAVGYGVGTFGSFATRWLFERDVLVKAKPHAWRVLYVASIVIIGVFLALGEAWQNELRTLVQVEPKEQAYVLRVLVLAILVGIGCVRLGRRVRRLYNWLLVRVDKLMPRRISVAASFVVMFMFISWVISGAFVGFLGTTSSYMFDRKNRSTAANITQPSLPTRSGSTPSHVTWDTIGREGQKFVSQGLSQAELQNFSGVAAKQQIRLYSGVNTAPTAQERADLVVQEIRRTKAFERKIVVITIPTGTGWINAPTVDALEYMYNGDTAIVAQQYSFLPSWISFLVDKERAQETGKELFNAVYAEWSKLPQDERPKLIMYGLSLGAFGGQAAFSGPGDLVHSIDGALWQGTPGDTELWQEVTRRRDAGTPQWQPVIDQHREIRFASQNDELPAKPSDWGSHRVLYLQHGSDPIVWFNFDELPLNEPDWFNEKRAPEVMNNTTWVPLLSFFQLAADQVVGMSVPKTYGHNYESTVARAWATVTTPDNWSEQKSAKLQSIIDAY